MKGKLLRILIVEDSEDDTLLVIRALKKGGFDPVYERVQTAAAMKKALKGKQWDIILCDYKMPKFSGASAIATLKEINIDIPLIIVSGTMSEEAAVECMRLGAHDYIMKGNLSRLCPAIDRELKELEVRNKQKQVESQRAAALTALQESEKKYRDLYDFLPIPVYEMDFEANITSANRAIYEKFGGTEEDLKKGFKAWQLLTPEAIDKSSRNIQRLLDGEDQVISSEYTLRKLDGSVFPAIVISTVIYSDGKPVGLRGAIIDIANRKRMESQREAAIKAMQDSEERYMALFNRSLDFVYLFDFEGRFIDANAAALNRLGYAREEIRSLNFVSLLSEDQLPLAVKTIQELLETGIQKSPIEFRVRHKNGSEVYVETQGSIIMSNGTPVAIQAIARDITERKQAERALRESEDKYKSLIENIPDIILTIDLEGKITFASRKIKEILGYENEEIINMTIFNFIPEEDHQRAMASLQKGMKGEKIKNFQVPMMTKSGGKLFFECSFTRIYKDGALVGAQGTVVDITERKQMEEALRKSEEKYRSIIENMQEGYFETDLPGNFTFVNDAVCKLMGYPREELIGKNNRQFANEEFSKKIYQAFNKIYRTEEAAKGIEHEYIRKDGIKGFTELSVSLVRDEEGKAIGFRCISHDITKRKQADEALRESEEKYRSILESIQEGYYEIDLAGNLTFFNDSLCLLLGYSKEELMGMNYRQYEDKESLERVFQAYNKVYKTGESIEGFDRQIIRKDGAKRYAEVSISLRKDSSGKPIGFRGIARDITERKQTEEKLLQTLSRLRKAFGTTIQVMVSAVEMRDPYTSGHQTRSSDIARAIATEMGFPSDKIDVIRLAGSIHDIGKLSIPAEILAKPTKLTDLEFSLIKEHPQIGYDMLKNVDSPWPLAEIVYQHHERMNGSGYPRKLKGDEIILEARIMAVADVVEAMASHRPYRPGLGIEAALEEIEKNKGILYDAAVADACLRLFREKNFHIR